MNTVPYAWTLLGCAGVSQATFSPAATGDVHSLIRERQRGLPAGGRCWVSVLAVYVQSGFRACGAMVAVGSSDATLGSSDACTAVSTAGHGHPSAWALTGGDVLHAALPPLKTQGWPTGDHERVPRVAGRRRGGSRARVGRSARGGRTRRASSCAAEPDAGFGRELCRGHT